ncbi:GNAT family N-acetyltransferase [Sphingobacterium suaedae]|uniref:GNAT family N-acetyltransferase n=1 Tax=Sphingobacterium suaedae TaxID=1686402 RepID=A0ABW5KMQ0_9SPHI
MTNQIYKAVPSQLPRLIELWESSIRASHHFLSEEDIGFYRELIRTYLPLMDVYCIDENGAAIGFAGLSEGMLEALFVHPGYTGKGIGKQLLLFAVHEKGIRRVDVNEQNQQALSFYEHFGFTIIGRSELDPSGRPYPILMLQLGEEEIQM